MVLNLLSLVVEASAQELPGLTVTLDKLVHHRDPNFPPETPHAFVYFLTINNISPHTVKFFGRKWIIRHPDGSTEVIQGDGIVGQTPTIPPGEQFSYNSYHLTGEPVTAEGAFHGETEDGQRVFVRIPLFEMIPPSSNS